MATKRLRKTWRWRVRRCRRPKQKAPVSRGLNRKRVNGFEPSIFTLATCARGLRDLLHRRRLRQLRSTRAPNMQQETGCSSGASAPSRWGSGRVILITCERSDTRDQAHGPRGALSTSLGISRITSDIPTSPSRSATQPAGSSSSYVSGRDPSWPAAPGSR